MAVGQGKFYFMKELQLVNLDKMVDYKAIILQFLMKLLFQARITNRYNNTKKLMVDEEVGIVCYQSNIA